jgi:hypothetical protein
MWLSCPEVQNWDLFSLHLKEGKKEKERKQESKELGTGGLHLLS